MSSVANLARRPSRDQPETGDSPLMTDAPLLSYVHLLGLPPNTRLLHLSPQVDHLRRLRERPPPIVFLVENGLMC